MKSISKAEGIHYGALSLICQQHFQPRTQFTWNQVIHTLCGVCCCCCWCCRMRWTDIIQAEDRNGNKTTKQTGRQQKKSRFERNCIHLSNDLNFIHSQKHEKEEEEIGEEGGGGRRWWLLIVQLWLMLKQCFATGNWYSTLVWFTKNGTLS